MTNSYAPRTRGRRVRTRRSRPVSGQRGSYRGRNRNRRTFGSQNRGRSRRNRFQASPINQAKFINKNPKAYAIAEYVATHTFADFGFHKGIVDILAKRGYTIPTHIQDESMPHILSGKDLIGIANTGTGKTAAFVLPIIQKLYLHKERESVLILTPTRELASQIQGEFKMFSEGMQLYSALCVGGLNIRAQIRELRRRPHVVIGTPGRLKDLINQGVLHLNAVTTLVFDEADRMLDMGFLPDIKSIIGNVPAERQSLCFSATMTPGVSKLLDTMFKDPVKISVRTSETGEHIAQDIIKAGTKEEKMKELVKMLEQDHFEKVLIFGQMKYGVQNLANTLTKMGFTAAAIHGNKSQPQRQRALDAFKQGKVNILVATDVAARGLDIPNVSHVINFDQPNTHDDYVHRIGRTGRAGKPGQAYTFV